MKLNEAKIKECAAWVEKNGLHPQACGATLKSFCEAMGISDKSFYDWMSKSSEFSEAIERARETFTQTTVKSVENALVKAALGVDFETTKEKGKAVDEVVREYDPATGKLVKETKTKKLVTVEAIRERRYYPPDVKAGIFILANMADDRWRQKQDVNVGTAGPGKVEITVGDQEAADALKTILATGGKPKDPE